MTRILLIVLLWTCSISNYCSFAQGAKESDDKKMEWFGDAKLGIFIHWGIYSVKGISESWAFYNNYINHENYMSQLKDFEAKNYNPNEWISLIEESGAKYAIITTKHHDGVSLWDSQADKAITTSKDSKAKIDVLDPFIKALKKTELKTGLYYSLPDWSHPYYDIKTRVKKRYDIDKDPVRWEKFVNYYQQQLSELSELYKPDLLWFDGDWEHTATEWKADSTLQILKKYNPNIIINSRLNHYGDYETPEQGIPVIKPESKYWELCYTMNDSWGYQPFDKHYKTPNMIIQTLVDCISMGGNLLLDIGPKADGTIPEEQINILKELGKWTKKHAQAIYATKAGLPAANYAGKSAFSKDGQKLYLYLNENKSNVVISGLNQTIKSARVIGDTQGSVKWTKNNDDWQLVLQRVEYDKYYTVLELEFSEPVSWYKPIYEKIQLTKFLTSTDLKPNSDLFYMIRQLHSGENIFEHKGMTNDGLDMSFDIKEEINSLVFSWISKHAEALYKTEKGLEEGHYAGLSALSEDKQTIYLFVEGKPTGPIALKGIKNGIARIRIVGEGSMIGHQVFNKLYWSSIPGIVYIDIPEERLDDNFTVIAVLLDSPLDLYREKVGAIESNL